MGTLKEKRLGKVVRDVSDWIEKNKEAIERSEELQFGARIVVKIKRYMRANGLSQKQLAEKLNVTPQYINKMLHGEAADMKISTAFRYGKILGIGLIEIPKDRPQPEKQVVHNYIPFNVFPRGSECNRFPTKAYPQQLLHRTLQTQDKYGNRPS